MSILPRHVLCSGDLVRQSAAILQVAQAYRLEIRILTLANLTPRFLTSPDVKHRFSPVLFDCSRYFTDAAAAEARIESSRHLQSLDEEMREVCAPLTWSYHVHLSQQPAKF